MCLLSFPQWNQEGSQRNLFSDNEMLMQKVFDFFLSFTTGSWTSSLKKVEKKIWNILTEMWQALAKEEKEVEKENWAFIS